jgi:cholesterol oxidase
MHDAVIVGSGFGGAVAACRLAEAGRDVLVLERGREWAPQDYPREPGDDWIWDVDEPHRQNGWIDLRIMDDMWVAQGAGVGGGSLIYANVSVDAPDGAFDDGWPAAINAQVLRPHYARVAQMLRPAELPDNQLTERTRLMREAAEKTGAASRFRKLPLAVTFAEDWNPEAPDPTSDMHSQRWTNPQGIEQGTCVHCGNCDIGCTVRAKNTLDLNYLAAARNAGAHIQPLSLVSHIEPLGGGWRVHYCRLEYGKRIPSYVDARQVMLAAGSLGSTEILLRSRDEYRTLRNLSPALGRNWSSNGDFLTPAIYHGRDIAPTVGPTISAAIDYLDGSRGGARFFVEDGGFPNVIGNYVAARLARKCGPFERKLLQKLRATFGENPFREIMPWFGQAVDGGDGRLYLGRRWYAPWRRVLKLDWDATRSQPGVDGLAAMHRELSVATGGKPLATPSWTNFGMLVTPHPLGGCNMATSPAAGVVDDRCAVFGQVGLYVVDGSVVPRPIGLNPSKTIAALAERCCTLLLEGH